MRPLPSLLKTIGDRKTELLKRLEAETSPFRLARFPPQVLRAILSQIYINICDEHFKLSNRLAFGSARIACDDFAASARREYGSYVGGVWSETFRTLEDANGKMTKLMKVHPNFLAMKETLKSGGQGMSRMTNRSMGTDANIQDTTMDHRQGRQSRKW